MQILDIISSCVRKSARATYAMKTLQKAAAAALTLFVFTACATIPAGMVTPLHEAVRDGNRAEALDLIEAGAEVNTRDENAQTPLHYCANNGEVALMRALLEAGADPNAVDSEGNTPLHFAAGNCYAESVEMLIDSGADNAIENNNGMRPADLAEKAGCTDIANLLS